VLAVGFLALTEVFGLVPRPPSITRQQLDRSTRVGYYSPDDGGVIIDDSLNSEMEKLEDKGQDADAWWDLFQESATSTGGQQSPNVAGKLIGQTVPTWIGDLSAWRQAINGTEIHSLVGQLATDRSDIEAIKFPPPSIMAYLSGSETLNEHHTNEINGYSAKVLRKGSMRLISAADRARLMEAFRVAHIVLWGKTTLRSMENSINRARGVACVLSELKADIDVVIAGILQDVYAQIQSDPNVTEIREALLKRFGIVIVDLCDKYNKLPKFMARKAEYSPEASENHIQMLVATAEDYRALYIRIADRLYTMRILNDLKHLDEMDRCKIAQEALHVYAPLAHKMNVNKVKGELEDKAFSILLPEAFKQTKYTQIKATKAYNEAANLIEELCDNEPFLKSQKAGYRITHRVKDKYQLHLKMVRKNLKSLSDVRDALGLRIVVDVPRLKSESPEANERRGESICYYLVDKLRQLPGWMPAENGFKDYILHKKENGYQSLHQYIKNKAHGTNVELQVRTIAMHQQAELGEAAHWYYKDMLYRPEIANSKLYRLAWRSSEQTLASSAAEVIGLAKKNLLANRVFVFLDDRATVLNLKKGSTALDAAFAIHTDLGMAAASVTVDGKSCRLDRPLRNGDTISVQRSETGVGAHPQWLTMVRTSHAKSALRQHFSKIERSRHAVLGLIQLMMALTLHSGTIRQYNTGLQEMPDARQLESWASERLGRDLCDTLVHMGDTSKYEVQATICRLLGVPEAEMGTSSIRWALTWARVQGRNGWDDKALRSRVLLPLLRESLVARGVMNVESQWLELVGPRSLSDDTSQYHTSLSRHLLKTTSPQVDGGDVIVGEEHVIAADSAAEVFVPSSAVSIPRQIVEPEVVEELAALDDSSSATQDRGSRLPEQRSFVPVTARSGSGLIMARPQKPRAYSLEAPALPRSLLSSERQKYYRKLSMRESFGSLVDKDS